ncbi:MAG: hypothetical protein GY705_22615 [Bacteroidetes bacterium]|nr:hypothetical protein [Bacteroidota bacterium]
MQYLKNENLKTLLLDWRGNPIKDNVFQYTDYSYHPDFKKMMKWQLSKNPQKKEKKADDWRIPMRSDPSILNEKRDFIVWLGHATFLIQMNGVRMITDPIFYDLPFLKRYSSIPFLEYEFTNIDYILLSHDHRDHCDKKSIQAILEYSDAEILTSLKMSNVIGKWVNGKSIQEAGWYQVYDSKDREIEIIYLPAQHWCRRGLFDFNRVLWGSFLIRTPDRTIYFGADSGLGEHFSDIGNLFPNIEIAILGIGAYKPDYIMQEIHTEPAEALEAFRKLGARRMIPMHYGTFDLSDEPMSEPYFLLQDLIEKKSMKNKVQFIGVGEPLLLP